MTDEQMKKFMEDQIEEIQIHKWIESEKAGHDLGSEAVKDFIKNHAAQFREDWLKNHPDCDK